MEEVRRKIEVGEGLVEEVRAKSDRREGRRINISRPSMERIPHEDNQNVSYSFIMGIPATLSTLNQPRNTGKCAIPRFLFVIPSCCSTGNDVSDT